MLSLLSHDEKVLILIYIETKIYTFTAYFYLGLKRNNLNVSHSLDCKIRPAMCIHCMK